jgi:hypothetical protein
MIQISPTDGDVFTALRGFLVAALPDGVDVVQGQQNRVPEPQAGSFVVMWPLSRPRLATNADAFQDNLFTASIAAGVMTVTSVEQGAVLAASSPLFGVGLDPASKVISQTTGSPGAAGTYAVSPPQNVASRPMATGQVLATQETEIVMQVDVHADDLATAGNLAATIATLFRDPYASDFFAANATAVAPLYADDPRQSPFLDAEQQYESRWTVDLHLQANQTVTGVPVQFAGALSVELVSVDAAFPPA